ncbi:larval cuticle protein LCP-22-like [Trichoplusia ni]|uniref:Larval cuticle protein LCP-22-like n=1 Tax=Trichoplusia ni TaxID=7111 RepID=A0A7E5VZT8_TRINI|nr:larval cuticle protein LCP-22-like [Trichoplusia ni]
MKFAVAFAAVLAVASAQLSAFAPFRQELRPSAPAPRPQAAVSGRVASSDQAASIIRYDNDVGPDGSYSYAVETDNGIAAQAQGTPRDFGGNPPIIPVVAQGSFSWVAPDGQNVVISYVADENGYQPSGDAIPTSPPVPPQIARALEYLARIPQKK